MKTPNPVSVPTGRQRRAELTAALARGTTRRWPRQNIEEVMRSIRIAFDLAVGMCFMVWAPGAAAAPLEDLKLAQGGETLRLGGDSLQTTIPSGPQFKAPVPKMQKFELARPPAVAAPVQLFIAATPTPTQQVLQLRR